MDLYEIYRRLKILPIYLFIKVFHIKLQNRIQLMETPVTQAMDLCGHNGDTPYVIQSHFLIKK